MALTVRDTSGEQVEPISVGVHIAVCYGIIDLGTHYDETWKKDKHEVLVQWELPACRGLFMRDGQEMDLPKAISRRYTFSLAEKAWLRQHLEAWRNTPFSADELQGFDIKSVLGASCQIQVVHGTSKKGRAFAKVNTIMALPDGTPPCRAENPLQYFSFEEMGPNDRIPDRIPSWVIEVILESNEWKAREQVLVHPDEADQTVDDTDIDDFIMPF